MLVLGIVSMLPFPAIYLLVFLDSGACVETVTVQQPFNLAVRSAGSNEFKWDFFLRSFHFTFCLCKLLPTPIYLSFRHMMVWHYQTKAIRLPFPLA